MRTSRLSQLPLRVSECQRKFWGSNVGFHVCRFTITSPYVLNSIADCRFHNCRLNLHWRQTQLTWPMNQFIGKWINWCFPHKNSCNLIVNWWHGGICRRHKTINILQERKGYRIHTITTLCRFTKLCNIRNSILFLSWKLFNSNRHNPMRYSPGICVLWHGGL